MPSLEISAKEFAKLESYRKFKKVSRRKALAEAIDILEQQREFEELVADIKNSNAHIDLDTMLTDVQAVVEEDRSKRRKG
jgi:hypothetical protein